MKTLVLYNKLDIANNSSNISLWPLKAAPAIVSAMYIKLGGGTVNWYKKDLFLGKNQRESRTIKKLNPKIG